ncbi:MAG: glycosyltransferase family 39 protein [Bradyrhizobiaceae bacterium]|nr:MAG: glycosyltransferase family 39 protein [Bradyrhizobiaceae bacterium]
MTAAEATPPTQGRLARAGRTAADFVEANPAGGFAIFAVFHFVVWTVMPTVLYPNLPLDLIEALTYGREWQLGHDKLPPLPWWIVEILYRLFHADIAYYAFAQITVLAAFALVFRLALPMVGPLAALASILIVDGLHYFTSTSPKFNHDVIQLPFWALAGVSYYYALRTGRIVHWMLLGFALGMAFWAKYFVVILAFPLALFLFADRKARPALRTSGPYVAALVALTVASPHLVWLVQHDFLPIHYVESRAIPPQGFLDHIKRPLSFAFGQFAWALPCLAIAASLFLRRTDKIEPYAVDAFGRRIVTLLTFGPMVTLLVSAAITGGKLIGMWGYPFWLFLGLWLVLRAGQIRERARFETLGWVWLFATACYALAFLIDMAVIPRLKDAPRTELFPGEVVAKELAARFRVETGEPVRYVIGTMYDGGNIAHYADEQPRNIIDGTYARSPWIDPADVKRHGALVVWFSANPRRVPDELRPLAGDAAAREPLVVPRRRGKGDAVIGWAIVKPQP